MPNKSESHNVITKAAMTTLGLSGVLHVLPSALALGTWSHAVRLPWGMCTWRGSSATDRDAGNEYVGSKYPGLSGSASNDNRQYVKGLSGNKGAGHRRASNNQVSRIAVTFDDGPDPRSTVPVLDRLDRLGIKATFFCLGSMIESYPDIVQEILYRGHDVGIHGYSHVAHLLRSPIWIWKDITRAKMELERIYQEYIIGYPGEFGHVRWFRPPKGVITGTTLLAGKYYGLDTVLWSAWGKEWTTNDPIRVANRVIDRLEDGTIVLLHDADTTSPPGTWNVAYEALPRIIEEAHNRNLWPVTISQLSNHGEP